ncbi:MAG: carbohydrate kinase family protein [Myxococcota bacterium]|nr:carbohydrate kinase family protein [Myxococcota bacterium]
MGTGPSGPRPENGGSSERPLWSFEGRPREVDVLGLGENSLDRLVGVLDWPVAGGKQEALDSSTAAGGQVASALLACTRLGLSAGYIGAVGADPEAEAVLAPLRAAGIDLSGVQSVPGARTRSALILVRARDGGRSVLARRDPTLRIDHSQLDRRRVEGAGLLHLDASDPEASLWAASVAEEAGRPVMLDADQTGEGLEKLLARIHFPVVSEAFARDWGGTGEILDGLRRLAGGVCRLAVATCGDRGAWAISSQGETHSPAWKVDVRDTTGAGDAFHAGLIWGILQRLGEHRALAAANAVAGLACTALGAQTGLPDFVELEGLLRRGERIPPGRPG